MNRPGPSTTLLLWALLCLASPCLAQFDFANANSTDWDIQTETDRIAADVSDIRQLALKEHVVAERQTKEALAEHIRTGLRRQLGEDEGRYFVEALVTLGALKEPVDLAETIINLASSQAAAHYDPGANKFYLLMTNMPLSLLSVTASHELCHALQDQHIDLSQFMEGDMELVRNNQDACAARQFLVEGDATHVMTTWMVKNTSGSTNPGTIAFVTSSMITMQAKLGYETLCKLGAQQAGENGMDFLLGALDEIDALPRFFVEPLFEAYFQGAALVDSVKAKGGWAAVDQLYKNPPTSSEQVLHPDKLTEPRDNPADISLADEMASLGPDWVETERDVMGELGIRVFLKVWLGSTIANAEAAVNAAAGWGADEYVLLHKSNSNSLVWKTLWDTENDANEFAMQWRLALAKRFPNMKPATVIRLDSSLPTQSWEVTPGRFIQLARKGLFVGILDTSDATIPSVLNWQ